MKLITAIVKPFTLDDVKTALGGDFPPVLRHQADVLRLGAQRDFEYLRRVPHLQVELGGEACAKPPYILILNMPPIRAQVDGDAVRARPFAGGGSGDDIRLAVVRPIHSRVTGLPQRGRMVDVHSQSHWSHWSHWSHVSHSL